MLQVLVSEVGSNGEVCKGYGEVLFLWLGEGGSPMAELRWFIDPKEVYHKPHERRYFTAKHNHRGEECRGRTGVLSIMSTCDVQAAVGGGDVRE